MRNSRWYLPRAAAALGVVAVAVLACTDRNPVAPALGGPGSGPGSPSARPIELSHLDCVASVAQRTVECRAPAADGGGAHGDLLYGGQNSLVTLSSANINYDTGTNKYTFDVRVRNLIPQAIGTTDGTTADPGGVKVWFQTQPTPTAGSGAITIDNADGTGTFTAPNQPYYAYVQRLDQYALSGARTWQFDVPPTVQSFAFRVYLSSPVQFPTGWIETTPTAFSLRRTYSRLATAKVFDQFGRQITGAVVTWSTADATLATVPADSGLVTGRLPGSVQIIATSTNDVPGTHGATQTGAAAFTITGTSLVWTAGAGSTDWNAAGNWDRAAAPVAQDSVTIPVVGPALYPVLTQNQQVGGVTVASGAVVTLGAFDLTSSQNVVASSTTGTGGITSTSGRLFLTGAAKNVSGRTPRMRVSGTYTMTGDINSDAPLRVDLGRIRNTSFRLRVVSQ